MRNARYPVLLACFFLVAACGSSSSSNGDAQASSSSSPAVTALAKAWTKAKNGEDPSVDCARAKAYATYDKGLGSTAAAALAQCNFDIPLRYFNTQLDEVEAGTRNCNSFVTSIATKLRAMTMSVDGIAKAADSKGSAEAEATKAIGDALFSESGEQARQRIKDSLRERAVAICPMTESLLGAR